ncbi:MAG: hypothetical protein XD75_0024 [Parcubacteria bacterium 33_209]|nr:MAG: hypothetical protein XD75_0024 [Parcubacteria bacterium 33_209]
MIFDLTDAMRDGYYPDEPAGEILFQMVEYALLRKEAEERIAIRREVEKGLEESAKSFVVVI